MPAIVTDTQPETVAVVVTYQPEIARLRHLLRELVAQADAVVLVDNASTEPGLPGLVEQCCPSIPCEFIRMERNAGIGAAQNVGIDWARRRGANHVLLMDQDSLPGPGMIDALRRAAQTCSSVAAVGPAYLDERHRQPASFIRVRGLRQIRQVRESGSGIVEADFLISSGSLIPLAAFDRVGALREDLFIDYVDVEWCLRARRDGLHCYGVFEAAMEHRLGESRVRVFGRQVAVRSPLRHYYLMRNALLLYREPWVPLNWKLVDAGHLFLKFGLYALAAPPRLRHCRMMVRGLWHGLTGRAGSWA